MIPTCPYKILNGLTRNDRLLEVPDDYSFQITNDDKTEVWYDPYGMRCLLCKSWCYPVMPDPKPCFECSECSFVFEVDFCKNQDIIGKKVMLNHDKNSKSTLSNHIVDDLD